MVFLPGIQGEWILFSAKRKPLFFGIFLVAATFKLRNRYANKRRLKPAATKNWVFRLDTVYPQKALRNIDRMTRSKIITVVNQKGGVGKTTTSVSLAAALGLAGYPILLIDLDPQGNATSGVGVAKDDRDRSVYPLILGQTGIEECIRATEFTNLSLVPSHPDLTGAEVELISFLGREYRLKEAINPIRDKYSFILIDCPPSLNILVINGLACADELIVPIQAEYYALEGISQLMGAIRLVRERLNPDLRISGVLLTMSDSRTRLSQQVIDEVRGFFKGDVFETVIPRNVRLGEAPSFGKPIQYYDDRSSGAMAYSALAEEITRKLT